MKSYYRVLWNSIFAFSLCIGLMPVFVQASDSNGTINTSHSYAWGENLGWINFAPTDNSNNYHGIVITDSSVLGYAWSPTFGWINFAPTHGGVTNNCSGQLGGYAWSEQLGWIPFDGVSINESGTFIGIAGDNVLSSGRISFNCDLCNVSTDWRQCSLRDQNSGGGGGGIPAISGSDGGMVGTVTTTVTLKTPLLYLPYSPSNNKTYFMSGIANQYMRIDLIIDGTRIKNWESTDENGRFDGWTDLSVDHDHEVSVIAHDDFGNQSLPSNIRIVKKINTIKPEDRPPVVDTTTTPPIHTETGESDIKTGDANTGSVQENTGSRGNSNSQSGTASSGGSSKESKPSISVFGRFVEKVKSFFGQEKNAGTTTPYSTGTVQNTGGILGFLSSNPIVVITGGSGILTVLLIVLRFIFLRIL